MSAAESSDSTACSMPVKLDHGIDAPGIRLTLFMGGLAELVGVISANWVRTS
jgi:hypothetical protein